MTNGTAVVHLHRLVPDAHAVAATAFTEQAEGGYSMRNVVKIDYPDDAEHRFSYLVAPGTTETVSMTFTARVGPDATCSARTTS